MQKADSQMYAVQILCMVVIGGAIAPLLKILYDPSKHYMDPRKRRFVGQSLLTDELRVLACTHNEHNASPLISFLQTSLPNPTCLFLLCLSPLVGQTTPILSRYKPKRHRKWTCRGASATDHIVNAFRYLEHNHFPLFSLQSHIGISPYTTMHNDICQLAFENKIAIVLIPFHRYADSDSGIIRTNPFVRAVNINVLHYAPCSVGIFIDRNASGNSCGLFRSVVVYFLGGDDDREVLAYVARMVDNASVGLTVIRPVLLEEFREGGEEARRDEEAVGEFRERAAGNKRVDYVEVEVKDGSEMIEVVKGKSADYSLVIVGRREGERSRLTAGMEMWSEYPELGVVGDVLASSDMGEKKVPTLVVQKNTVPRYGEFDEFEYK